MYLDDLRVGMEFTAEPVTIDKDKMVAFALEYDPFPLHYDEEFAQNTRYGTITAPGVMSFMSVWAKVLELNFLGDEMIAGLSTSMRWLKPVFAGDVLTGKALIKAIHRRNAYNGIAEVSVDIFNQHGELVLESLTESVVKYRTDA